MQLNNAKLVVFPGQIHGLLMDGRTGERTGVKIILMTGQPLYAAKVAVVT